MDSVIIFCAKYLFVFVVLIAVTAWLQAAKNRKTEMAAVIIVSGILALIVSRIAAKLYYDPRPFVTHNVKPLFSHIADNGFPSDHALLTMTLTAAVYFYSKKWAGIALILTVIVGAARVLAHVHSPIDIIGAWVISIVSAAAVYYSLKSVSWFKPEKHGGQTEDG